MRTSQKWLDAALMRGAKASLFALPAWVLVASLSCLSSSCRGGVATGKRSDEALPAAIGGSSVQRRVAAPGPAPGRAPGPVQDREPPTAQASSASLIGLRILSYSAGPNDGSKPRGGHYSIVVTPIGTHRPTSCRRHDDPPQSS